MTYVGTICPACGRLFKDFTEYVGQSIFCSIRCSVASYDQCEHKRSVDTCIFCAEEKKVTTEEMQSKIQELEARISKLDPFGEVEKVFKEKDELVRQNYLRREFYDLIDKVLLLRSVNPTETQEEVELLDKMDKLWQDMDMNSKDEINRVSNTIADLKMQLNALAKQLQQQK